MQTPIKRIVNAIKWVEAEEYDINQLRGAIYGASNTQYDVYTGNMPCVQFERLNEKIKTSVKNPEADARAIMEHDYIMDADQYLPMAETIYKKYKPVIGEGGAGGAGPAPIGEGGAGGAGPSSDVERLQGLFGVAHTNSQVTLVHLRGLRQEIALAETAHADARALEVETRDKLHEAIATRVNKRKRDQA
jgi:hypothetical protein